MATTAETPELTSLGGQHMVLNMGPQHPATHGVLRLVGFTSRSSP
jgi:NADH:ubiquinone oxidoreductase subunit D